MHQPKLWNGNASVIYRYSTFTFWLLNGQKYVCPNRALAGNSLVNLTLHGYL